MTITGKLRTLSFIGEDEVLHWDDQLGEWRTISRVAYDLAETLKAGREVDGSAYARKAPE